ncbi:MAG TPA: N-6 DNA methylase [Bacteroidales bacterium]|nr:N-6 DNA methylase [Bacteroidales bacterium]
MHFPGIRIQGNIISGEILEKIRDEEIPFQTPADFGFDRNTRIRDEIGTAWAEAKALWMIFKGKREKLDESDPGTTITRKIWMTPFLLELGYDLEPYHQARLVNSKTFFVSHHENDREEFPVHIVGVNDKLDKISSSGVPRLSPHALMQEYLNNTEYLYGLVSNGRHLRLLRDSSRLANLAYVEFDLEKIMDEDLYTDFAILYRLLHSSRMPRSQGEVEKSVIEFYHQEAIESGARIRGKLRQRVKEAMEIMARGFLQNPANVQFIEKIRTGRVKSNDFYHTLLTVIYRLIFLTVTEERNLIFTKPDDLSKRKELEAFRKIYTAHYSIDHLRELALKKIFIDVRKVNLWMSLISTFRLFEPRGYGEKLGIQPLGGDLFSDRGLIFNDLDMGEFHLDNDSTLQIIEKLSFIEESGSRIRVNYGDLDVEELGSVYEALLELHPYFSTVTDEVLFGFTESSERKLTGSYYTRSDLVHKLIKSALVPVIRERISANTNKEEKIKALLDIKVCDPAAGSGHFLLAAARTLAMELAKIRADAEIPEEAVYRRSLNDVLNHCIYGVDKNPAAVELCRVSLWLEGHNAGHSLSFLEHRIKCGDSIVGVDKLERLSQGIPEGAFSPLTDDDRALCSLLKRSNNEFIRMGQTNLFGMQGALEDDSGALASEVRKLDEIPDNTLESYEQKKRLYEKIRTGNQWWKDWTACNLLTYAFFQQYTAGRAEKEFVTSEFLARFLQASGSVDARLEGRANAYGTENRFFHWPLEFPDVFEKGGFDVMLGNPPWERIKLQEKEFFETRDPEIANAPNKAARERLIRQLEQKNPELSREYKAELHYSEASSQFIRESYRFPLAGRGDVNTYSIFSELNKSLINSSGRAGFVVPTGIATDDTNKYYFSSIIEGNQLVSLYDFENRKKIFPDVDSRYKFCLITISGTSLSKGQKAQFGFFLHDVLDLNDELRVFGLTREDFIQINPNTRTCPIFRTSVDAELTARIYNKVPVLINEERGWNPWGVKFMAMFHMSNDSHLFKTEPELRSMGFELRGNRFVKGREIWLPLYESKMIWHYDHRFGTYKGVDSRTSTQTPTPTLQQYQDPTHIIQPWYWVSLEEVLQVTDKISWFTGFRNITNTTNERTSIFSLIPGSAVGHSMPLIFSESVPSNQVCMISNFSTLPFDYFVRQKVGGTNMTFGYILQFPVLSPDILSSKDIHFVSTRFMELVYTAWDIKLFADELWKESDEDLKKEIKAQWEDNKQATGGHPWSPPDWAEIEPEGIPLPPFKWDEDRRAQLKAELDAYYAKLYGLTRDELRYILDPQDVYGPDFPGETFRVLKEKEIRHYGEYRTRRLVLKAFDKITDFDEEEHGRRMRQVWEDYQMRGERREEKGEIKIQKAKSKEQRAKINPQGNTLSMAAEKKGVFRQPKLFEEPHLFNQEPRKVDQNCKVIIRRADGTVFRYHITPTAQKGYLTGNYRQILPVSALALATMDKKAGDGFEFGEVRYEVVEVG